MTEPADNIAPTEEGLLPPVARRLTIAMLAIPGSLVALALMVGMGRSSLVLVAAAVIFGWSQMSGA